MSQQQPTGFPTGSPSDNKTRPGFSQSGKRRWLGAKVLVGAGALLLGVLAPAGVAFASTASTSSATLTSGSLSIGTVTPETVSVPVAGTSTGILPSAKWSDTTGSGDGWDGTVAVSDLVYTGSWKAEGSATALDTATSGAYTGTVDGDEYTITTGTITSGAGSYTWTSNNPGGSGSYNGSGNADASTANAVGTRGITIDFGTQSLASGSVYEIKAGTLPASAMSLDTLATGSGVTASSGTTSEAPALVGSGVGQTDYGTAVKFVSALADTGMGTYTVNPGVKVTADASSWAATYAAGVEYSIVTGP